jgi:ribonucleoside-triphosphate reductase
MNTGGIIMNATNNTTVGKAGEGIGFERIRRITGYLVGTMDKWNDAKKAEEHDRVKHSLSR